MANVTILDASFLQKIYQAGGLRLLQKVLDTYPDPRVTDSVVREISRNPVNDPAGQALTDFIHTSTAQGKLGVINTQTEAGFIAKRDAGQCSDPIAAGKNIADDGIVNEIVPQNKGTRYGILTDDGGLRNRLQTKAITNANPLGVSDFLDAGVKSGAITNAEIPAIRLRYANLNVWTSAPPTVFTVETRVPFPTRFKFTIALQKLLATTTIP